jgi:hypothetical protein
MDGDMSTHGDAVKAENLALGRATLQSSHWEGAIEYDYIGACNGIKNGAFSFHTLLEDGPWWQVDLGSACSIDEVRVFNRLDFARRAESLSVLCSADGRTWNLLHDGSTTRSSFGGVDGSPLVCIASPRPVARFVRLELNERQVLHLDEVEVYGERLVPIGSSHDLHGPPVAPPEEFVRAAMNDGIPVLHWYFDDRVGADPQIFDGEMYEKAFDELRRGEFSYYSETLAWLLAAIDEFPLTGKTVLVMGLVSVNCDAIALYRGASAVFVIEYNLPVSDHPDVEVMRLEDFLRSGIAVDAILSISTIEHDGLGRYGDPLDPDGDLRAMREVRGCLKPGGLMYLSVPVGKDCLVWNAHRIYGSRRLPLLTSGWETLAVFGPELAELEGAGVGHYRQPVFVIRTS